MLVFLIMLRSCLLWYVWIKYGNNVKTRYICVHQKDEFFKTSQLHHYLLLYNKKVTMTLA